MTIRLSLDCPHCQKTVTLDVGARVVGIDGGGLRTVVAATPVPVKKGKSVCACGHGREWHSGHVSSGGGAGPCTYGHGSLAGGCDCPGYHGRRRASPHVKLQVNGAAMTSLSSGERAVLTAIAQNGPRGATKEELTVVTGYKRSTRDLYVQELARAGLVERRDGSIFATPSGVGALGPDFEPLPTGDRLLAHWLAKLPEGERLFLEILARSYPEAVSKEKLGQIAEYKRSTRDLYVQQLVRRQLVEKFGGPGRVRASPLLFGPERQGVAS